MLPRVSCTCFEGPGKGGIQSLAECVLDLAGVGHRGIFGRGDACRFRKLPDHAVEYSGEISRPEVVVTRP